MTHGALRQKIFHLILEGEMDDLEVYGVMNEVKRRFDLSPEVLNALLDTALNSYGVLYGKRLSGPAKRQKWGVLSFLSCLCYFDLGLKPSIIVALQMRDIIPREDGSGVLLIRKADRTTGRPPKADIGELPLNGIQVLQFLKSFSILHLKPNDFIVSTRRDGSGLPMPISVDNLLARIKGVIGAAARKYPPLKGDLESLSKA